MFTQISYPHKYIKCLLKYIIMLQYNLNRSIAEYDFEKSTAALARNHAFGIIVSVASTRLVFF